MNLNRLKRGGITVRKQTMHGKSAFETVKANGYNLDIKDPFVKEEEVTHTTAELLELLHWSFVKSDELLTELRESI